MFQVNEWREFDVAVSQWRLGELATEQLPFVARKALNKGCKSRALSALAATEFASCNEAELVDKVMRERGFTSPGEGQAIKVVADDTALKMLTGDLIPEQAAHRLRELAWKKIDGPQWKDLGVFSHLGLDWAIADSSGASRDQLRESMLSEARSLMARGGVRAA